MPVFRLTEEILFPPPEMAEPDGLLAVGGDLCPERLLLAYSEGIFPWYSEDSPILWWSPDPRLVLFPAELRVSRSLRQRIRRGEYSTAVDTDFESVIDACARVHGREEEGTWITPEMRDAYITLHRMGHAHSVESLRDGELVGGLYGVALGAAFFGESMFAAATDASKVALVALVERLVERGFTLIDCQVSTEHLKSMGAREILRSEFLRHLREALTFPLPPGPWHDTRADSTDRSRRHGKTSSQ
jgi:leucyl/phenylalanyl-tRNA--protein transferase